MVGTSLSGVEELQYYDASSDGFKLYAVKGVCICDVNGIKITVSDRPTTKNSLIYGIQLIIPVIIENHSQKNISLSISDSSVNDWACGSNISGQVPAGKKKKTEIQFNLDDTDITAIDSEECSSLYNSTFSGMYKMDLHQFYTNLSFKMT